MCSIENAARSLLIRRPPLSLVPFLHPNATITNRIGIRHIAASSKHVLKYHPAQLPICPRTKTATAAPSSLRQWSSRCSQTRTFHGSSLLAREDSDTKTREKPRVARRGKREKKTKAEKAEHVENAVSLGHLGDEQSQQAVSSAQITRETEPVPHLLDVTSLVAGVEADIFGLPREEEANPSVEVVPAAQTTTSADGTTQGQAQGLDKASRAEMTRVVTKLLQARTDMDLWQVLEKEVFSQIRGLNLDAKPTGTAPDATGAITPALEVSSAKAKNKRSKKPARDKSAQKQENPGEKSTAPPAAEQPQQQNESAQDSQPHPQTQTQTPTTLTISTLQKTYAPILLAATRILTPTRSPLPAAILPQARALGPISYALAATTPLYNELLAWTWRTTGSYAAVAALLGEMEEAGLALDAGTLEVVDGVCEYRAWAARFGDGSLGEREGQEQGRREPEPELDLEAAVEVETETEEVAEIKAEAEELREEVGEPHSEDEAGSWTLSGVAAIEGLKGRTADAEAFVAWREKIRAGIEEMEVERVRRAEALRRMAAEDDDEDDEDGERDSEGDDEGVGVTVGDTRMGMGTGVGTGKRGPARTVWRRVRRWPGGET